MREHRNEGDARNRTANHSGRTPPARRGVLDRIADFARSRRGFLLPAAAMIAVAAAAGAARAAVLELVTGEIVAGDVAKLDDQGVTFVPEKGGEVRAAWDRVAPRCRYDLTRAALRPGDAAGLVGLAKWAADAGFHRLARRDLIEAGGLGYSGPEDLKALIAGVTRAEADATLETVDELVARGQPDAALERVKAYLRAADPGPDADRVRARVTDLVARIERAEEEARQAEEERRKAEKEGKLRDWALKTVQSADRRKDEAGAAAADAFAWIARGNQSRAREFLAKAESRYQAARTEYARVRKALREGPVADECAERAKDCDGRTVEVLVRWGRMEAGNKAWKLASPVVDRGLRIDAVSRELLELRAEIDRNWIRRKLSDTTNARGHASSM